MRIVSTLQLVTITITHYVIVMHSKYLDFIVHHFFLVETIKIDLPRTYPDNIYFETMQGQLFNILAAYSVHNPEVGYCQGLNYIAGK